MNSQAQEPKLEQMQKRIEQLEKENQQLKQRHEFHQIIFERALDAIIIFDKNTNFIEVNKAACDMFEQPKEELLNRNFKDFLELVPKELIDYHNEVLEEEGVLSDEILIKLDSGKVKHIEFAAKKDAINGYDLSIMRDISARKLLEREKTISMQMFRDVFQKAIDGIVIFDQEGRIIDVNPSFCASMGLEFDEMLTTSLDQFVSDEDHYKLDKLSKTLREKGKAKGELPLTLENGQKRYFEFTATANIYNGLYLSILRDVTEKRNMEIQLQKSEERFREMFENAMDAIIIWDNDGQFIKANPAASRTFELPLDQLLQKKLFDFLDRENPLVKKLYQEFLEKGELRAELDFHMPNGECKHLEFTSKKNVIDGYNFTIFRNVSERRKMEKELRESGQKFRKIFDSAMDGIILFDHQCNILDANPVACEILEIPKGSEKNKNLHEVFSNTKIDCDEFVGKLFEYGELSSEFPIKVQSGKEKVLDFSAKHDIIPNVNMAFFRDITEKKEMEEQLRKSDTLNVVGELAAGIAHEIRNPMTALKGFIQLLQSSIKEDFSMYFNVITSELQRIESIITEFLVLAKPQAVSYQQKDATKIMKDTIDLLNPQALLVNVQFKTEIDNDLPNIYCEPNQLKQVFINLLKNAIEVMPNGGTITVKMKRKDINHIIISITDEGIGIPEDKLKKLGEPFYTTKERGTGLGLMVSYKIIEEHYGKIEVESVVGEGTTFHITLPIQPDKEEDKREIRISNHAK
jgi:two-component system, sporulation sensor kinase E